MKVGLIITTYNWKEALRLVLDSVKLQTRMPDEVVIADDGSRQDTASLIQFYQKEFPCALKHTWQEDKGFRAASSRNNAIRALSEDIDYVILIDGDMVLHSQFIEDHIRFSEPNCFIQGSRVLVTEDKTQALFLEENPDLTFNFFSAGILKRKNTLRYSLLAKMLAKPNQNLTGIRTCNMSFWKSDLYKVNGFNEAFIGWGREDSELVVRLFNTGVKRKDLKFSALAYHLFHHESSRTALSENEALLQTSIRLNLTSCAYGVTDDKSNT